MDKNNLVMKSRLFGDPYGALNLWEFRRELTLLKRLVKIAENCVLKKETHEPDSFEGVCFYIARSIVAYSKAAFDNLVLGHLDATEMVIRSIVENRVILDIIYNDETISLWKYYLVYSHYKSLRQTKNNPEIRIRFAEWCAELGIETDFIEKRGNKKPYIEFSYGWTYKLATIESKNRFTFKGLCDAAEGKQRNYKDFQWMSKAVHGTSYFEKVINYADAMRIVSLLSSIYINLYLLVVMFCDGIWDEDFDLVTEELEALFFHFIEENDPTDD